MPILQNTAEGQTTGTVPTTGNSGGASGDAFSVVTGTVAFDSTVSHTGVNSYKMSPASGGMGWASLGATSNSLTAARGYFLLTAFPDANQQFFNLRNNGSTRFGLTLLTNGKFFYNSTNATYVCPLNTWLRLESSFNQTTLAFAWGLYLADSLTPQDGTTGTLASSANAPTQISFGKISAAGGLATHYWDDVAYQTGSTTFIGPNVFTGSLGLSGGGTMSEAGSPNISGAVALSSSGAQARSGSPVVGSSLARAGAGSLDFLGAPEIAAAVNLYASGSTSFAGHKVSQPEPYRVYSRLDAGQPSSELAPSFAVSTRLASKEVHDA